MSSGTAPIGAIINISTLARELGRSRRSLTRDLKHGKCPIQPVPGMKPAKFRVVDVEAFTGRPVGQCGE